LNGVSFNVAVTGGDLPDAVAAKIRATAFSGWSVGGTANTVLFTCLTTGTRTNATYSAGTTGCVATMTTTQEGSTGTPRPDPKRTDTKCVSEIYRKAIQSIDYLDVNGNVTAVPTNVIEVTATFNKDEAVGSWREFAIVGGNATATKDTGININYKTHGLIEKTNEMTVTRKIRFTFIVT
jgi:hypothetical protein